MTVAKQVLRDYSPVDDLWPSGHLPKRLAAAREKYAEYLGDSTSAESSG